MDKFSDRNDNNEKNVNNWHKKTNNNVEHCVNNEKVGEKSWHKKLIITNGESQLQLLDENNQPVNECCKDVSVRNGEKCEEDNQGDKMSNKSDSTENLSFLNENDFIDDLIPLQDYVISDDEVSNPDNCVYAYRGSVSESPEPQRPQLPQDDETDFLEMDFEPEPNSEADASSFMELNSALLNQPSISSTANNKSEEPPDKLKLVQKIVNKAIENESSQQQSKSEITDEKFLYSINNCGLSSNSEILVNNGLVKATGAIPKRTSSINKTPSSSSIASLQAQVSSSINCKIPLKNRSRDQPFNDNYQSEIQSCRTNEIKSEIFNGISTFRNVEKSRIETFSKYYFSDDKYSKIQETSIFDDNQKEFLEQVNLKIIKYLCRLSDLLKKIFINVQFLFNYS